MTGSKGESRRFGSVKMVGDLGRFRLNLPTHTWFSMAGNGS